MGKRVCEKEYLGRVEHFAFYKYDVSSVAEGLADIFGCAVFRIYYNVT